MAELTAFWDAARRATPDEVSQAEMSASPPRLRDSHDLWHVLTGYGRDGFGGALEGRRRGRAAVWLPAQDWQVLLRLPLDSVREALAIRPSTRYAPISDTGSHQPQEQAIAA